MPLKILGLSKDLRTNTLIAYGQVDIPTYLRLVGPDFDDFNIQRRRENHKAYHRMKQDIIQGAQLPAITLAIKPDTVSRYERPLKQQDLVELENLLNNGPELHILDGLQRTYILKDIQRSEVQFNADQRLLVEFWFERSLKVLIYRIIVLNAGQKPMSMRHQVELLFETIVDKLREDIAGLEVLKEREEESRLRPRQFRLVQLVSAYQSYLLRSPEVTKESIVAQQLNEEDLFEVTEDQAEKGFLEFKSLLNCYAGLDEDVCRVYPGGPNGAIGAPKGLSWWGSENVMNSFFAAVSDFRRDPDRAVRVDRTLDLLRAKLAEAPIGSDPLGLANYQKVQKDINPRKANVGFATRRLLLNGFKEYFRDEGHTPLSTLWAREAP